MRSDTRIVQSPLVAVIALFGLSGPVASQSPPFLQQGSGSLSPNTGQYANQIGRLEPPEAYTEICFIAETVGSDQHNGTESTNGGNCAPGDIGWIIEQEERPAKCWDAAKAACLQLGMRLPGPFEFHYSCRNSVAFGLNGMTGNYEWATNSAFPIADSVRGSGLGATIAGNLGCGNATWDWVARGDADQCDPRPFRCVH